MSVQDITDVIRYSKSGGIDRLILICLANYTDEDHKCWPSIKKLIRDSGVSERTVQRAVDSLVELGELTKVERQRENGADTSNIYRVSVCHPPRCQSDTPPVSESHPKNLLYESSSSLKEKKIEPASKAKPKDETEVVIYCCSLNLPGSDAEYFWNHWNANGFINSGKPIKDWKAVIRSWKAGGFLPSQKNGSNGSKPTPIRYRGDGSPIYK